MATKITANQFYKESKELILKMGGIETDKHYPFRINTKYGVLQIETTTKYNYFKDDFHLHCCFDDVQKAQPILNYSYSGKWNHYGTKEQLLNVLKLVSTWDIQPMDKAVYVERNLIF